MPWYVKSTHEPIWHRVNGLHEGVARCGAYLAPSRDVRDASQDSPPQPSCSACSKAPKEENADGHD